MSTNKPEALRLADCLETKHFSFRDIAYAAAELRQLHELNQKLYSALSLIANAEYSPLGFAYCKVIARTAISKVEKP